MRRLALFLILTSSTPLVAHHNAWAPDRSRSITIEGTVEAFLFADPHVEIRIRTAQDVVYAAEWQTMGFLSNAGITSVTLKTGDHLIVRGSPYKDPTIPKLTLLAEVRRPADGWRWTSPTYK